MEDGLMTGYEGLEIRQKNDWANHSKIVIKTDNRDLLNSLIHKISVMSENEFDRVIYNFGCRESELHIFSNLGTGIVVLYHLLDGQDYDRLSTEATIETIN